jgi:NAD-dependent deacetylase
MATAFSAVKAADVLVVVGTSLQVYPAANLAFSAPPAARRILIDPNPPAVDGFEVIACGAREGLGRVRI